MHVEVLVGAQAPAEEHVLLPRRHLAVGGERRAVRRRGDRIVRLVPGAREARVLALNNRVRRPASIPLGVQVRELVDARKGDVPIRVVHDRAALVVGHVHDLGLEIEGAPAELAGLVVEVAVDRARVDDGDLADCRGLRERRGGIEEVHARVHGDTRVVDHVRDPRAVAVQGQALVAVLEVAVLVGEAHGQARDDGGGQLTRVGLPLLGRVPRDEGVVEGPADQANRLLLEVARFARDLGGLLLDERACLGRRIRGSEELVDRAQVDGQRVDDAPVVGVDAVAVVVEGGETVDVRPDALVRGVEEVGAVAVHFDAGGLVDRGVGVASDVVATLDEGHVHSESLRGLAGERQAKKARPNNEQIHATPLSR